jgi:hypothetical protein
MGKLAIGTAGVIGFVCIALLVVAAVVLVSLVIIAPAYSLAAWRRFLLMIGATGFRNQLQNAQANSHHQALPSWIQEPSNDR